MIYRRRSGIASLCRFAEPFTIMLTRHRTGLAHPLLKHIPARTPWSL